MRASSCPKPISRQARLVRQQQQPLKRRNEFQFTNCMKGRDEMIGEPAIRIDQRKAWTVVTLLFFYSVINFFDKLVLGLAAVPIMKELGLTPAQYGLVASSF